MPVVLGLSPIEGLGAPKDFRKAAGLYREAAEANDANAQYNYGVMSATGIGVTQNWADAYAYLTLAANQNIAEAKEALTNISGFISPEDMAAGKDLAASKAKKASASSDSKASGGKTSVEEKHSGSDHKADSSSTSTSKKSSW